MAERRKRAELRARVSRDNLDFLERYAAARHLTAAKIIDLSLSRLRAEESVEQTAESARPSPAVSSEVRAKFDRLAAVDFASITRRDGPCEHGPCHRASRLSGDEHGPRHDARGMPTGERRPRHRAPGGRFGARLARHGDGELPANEHGQVPRKERSRARGNRLRGDSLRLVAGDRSQPDRLKRRLTAGKGLPCDLDRRPVVSSRLYLPRSERAHVDQEPQDRSRASTGRGFSPDGKAHIGG